MTGLDPADYADGATRLTGWVARPATAPRAAVLVWPTIMNLTAAIADKARALAAAGYIAFVGDYYGRTPADFAEASHLADALRADPRRYRARLAAGLAALDQVTGGLPRVTIGFCMGGQAALELARAGEDLVLAASFHGLLDTRLPADRPIPARILVCHGDADALVPREQVIAFWQEMDAVGANWHFHSYAGVPHGFTNPHPSPANGTVFYNASADRQSWAALRNLLDEVLGR